MKSLSCSFHSRSFLCTKYWIYISLNASVESSFSIFSYSLHCIHISSCFKNEINKQGKETTSSNNMYASWIDNRRINFRSGNLLIYWLLNTLQTSVQELRPTFLFCIMGLQNECGGFSIAWLHLQNQIHYLFYKNILLNENENILIKTYLSFYQISYLKFFQTQI